MLRTSAIAFTRAAQHRQEALGGNVGMADAEEVVRRHVVYTSWIAALKASRAKAQVIKV